MTEAFLEEYFTGVATALKAIAHLPDQKAFYRMTDPNDLDEFDNAVRSMKKSTCMLLEIGSGSMGEWDSQNDMPRIGLHVLIKTTDLPADKNTARDQAKTILAKVVSRMRYDCKSSFERTDDTIGPLKAQNVVMPSRVKYSNMSGIDGNWYGKSFYIDFTVPINLVYNPDDWSA